MGLQGQNVMEGTQARKHRDLDPKSHVGENLTLLHSCPSFLIWKWKTWIQWSSWKKRGRMWNEKHESNINGLIISKCPNHPPPHTHTHTRVPTLVFPSVEQSLELWIAERAQYPESHPSYNSFPLCPSVSPSVSEGVGFSLASQPECAVAIHPWLMKAEFPLLQGPTVLGVLNGFPGDPEVDFHLGVLPSQSL